MTVSEALGTTGLILLFAALRGITLVAKGHATPAHVAQMKKVIDATAITVPSVTSAYPILLRSDAKDPPAMRMKRAAGIKSSSFRVGGVVNPRATGST